MLQRKTNAISVGQVRRHVAKHARSKSKLSGLSRPQAITTSKGMTNIAIWMLEPTATPIAKSILFLYDAVTAVACSAALDTIGKRTNPIQVLGTLKVSLKGSIVSTSHSDAVVMKTSGHVSMREE